jgi:hypothetical protein
LEHTPLLRERSIGIGAILFVEEEELSFLGRIREPRRRVRVRGLRRGALLLSLLSGILVVSVVIFIFEDDFFLSSSLLADVDVDIDAVLLLILAAIVAAVAANLLNDSLRRLNQYRDRARVVL